jgi:hypothetical protein
MGDPATFLVARNPDPGSSLPYVLRVPLGDGLVLKAKSDWPRSARVYCHPAQEGWPDDAELIEEVPVRHCARRGAAIDIVLDRSRNNRAQFVFVKARGGREMILWQTPKAVRGARPGIRIPTRRASGFEEITVVVDSRERYGYRFPGRPVVTARAALPAGDYAVRSGDTTIAAVERKTLADFATSLTDGTLGFAIAELSELRAAAIVVEGRYSDLLRNPHAAPGFLADLTARLQVRHPGVPVVFAETRKLAEEWTYRFLAAALAELAER